MLAALLIGCSGPSRLPTQASQAAAAGAPDPFALSIGQGRPTVIGLGASACASCRDMKVVLEALRKPLGLAAARLGIPMGTLPGVWTVGAGLLIVAAGVWIGWRRTDGGFSLPARLQRRLAGSGWLGALVRGSVMTP